MRDDTIQALRDLVESLEAHNGDHEDQGPAFCIDWHDLYNTTVEDEVWLAWPLVPAQRQVVIYSLPKVGKSLIVLDLAASIASGKPILGQPNPHGRRHVLYLDYEMTAADLLARLIEMGYEPDELDHLHYALLPIIPALNTKEGAAFVRGKAAEYDAELVIVDTVSRAIEGDPNDQVAINAFYNWTGKALKADGRALIRLDHEGKDAAKGMIGSIMKAADIDIVWHLAKTDEGVKLTRKYTRIQWGVDEVAVTVHRDPLRHTIAPRGYAAGTNAVVKMLDGLGLADDISVRAARKALKDAGESASSDALQDACRSRKARVDLEDLISSSETDTQHVVSEAEERTAVHLSEAGVPASNGTPKHTPSDLGGTPSGTHRYTDLCTVPPVPPPIGGYGHGTGSETSERDDYEPLFGED
jgi:hypothetical protein